jgi:hypothetical protein
MRNHAAMVKPRNVYGFTRFEPPEYEKCGSWNAVPMHLCVYVCMCSSLTPERLDGFHSNSAFNSSSVTGRFPVD